jgi:3-oxoacyl-[acyl-carrier-protein] synthase-1/3-oxoacyl-[acyl-carrier-protein] synthase II
MRKQPHVSVTGMGCICAAGLNVDECLASLATGRRDPREPSRFHNEHSQPFPVFEIPEHRLGDAGLAVHDRTLTVRVARHAALEALEQAGLGTGDLESARVGVCIGTSVGAALNFLEFYREHRQNTRQDLVPIHRYLNSNPALALAQDLGTHGPIQTVVNACSSGTDAIGQGAAWIRMGLCDVVIAGGADELSEVTYNGFIRLMNVDSAPCRPFDRSRKGLNLGEGAGMIVLESKNYRNKREAREIAGMCGYGTVADAYHLTAPHPKGLGLKKAIDQALTQAGTDRRHIAFINAHGTATSNNDMAEATVFRELFPTTPFIATKGVTGHTLGAAGAIEAIFTIAHLASGQLPASPGFTHPDPKLQVIPTTQPTRISGEFALSQSLAFGGNNSVLVIKKGGDEHANGC